MDHVVIEHVNRIKIGELNIFLEHHSFMVMLTLHSKVHMYLRVYSPEFILITKVMSGAVTVHLLVMSTPSMVKSVDLHSSMVMVILARLMFINTMVILQNLELLVHCSHSIVQLR